MERFRIPDQFDEAVAASVDALRRGEIILYPTDTVYGLGADVSNVRAVEHVRAIKGKDANTALLIVVRDLAMMNMYGVVTPLAQRLAALFLPGPISLVLEARKTLQSIPGEEHAGTVGVRIPDNTFCIEVAKRFGRPYVSTSANRSGSTPQSSPDEILKQLGEHADAVSVVVDAGPLSSVLSSTVIDARGGEPLFLREGALSRTDVELALLSLEKR